jgi:hypothetical protein
MLYDHRHKLRKLLIRCLYGVSATTRWHVGKLYRKREVMRKIKHLTGACDSRA